MLPPPRRACPRARWRRYILRGALAGAARILLNQEDRAGLDSIARLSTHVSLGGDPRFNERYVENMLFPEGEPGAGL